MADPMLQALAGQGTLAGGRPITLAPDTNLAGLAGIDGPQSMLLNMVLQPLIGRFVGDRYMSAQFSPQGNLYDQMRAKAQFAAQQQAMRMGSEIDQRSYLQMFQGMSAAAGTPFGVRERRAAMAMTEDMSRIMPMLAPTMPELFDRLHGSRGSALIMAQQMNMGGRYMLDPLTGRTGMSTDSVGDVTRRVYDRLYGEGADVRQMRGLGAGRAGQLFDEMSRRGLMGTGLGRDDAMDRVARQEQTTIAELRKLDNPTIDAKLRSFEADRIVDKLKNMAGAVAAMQDIFGEMGQPDAPMNVLMNGLQMLTQNGLQSMTPEQAERTVRTSANVARSAGVSMSTMMELVATGAQRSDQLGLDRRFAASSATGAVAFGQAYGAMAGGLRRFGLANKDQAIAIGQQLELNAAASPIAQQLATVVRLQEEFGGFAAGSEGAALYAAVKRGDNEFEFGGRRRSVHLPSGTGAGSFTDVMSRSGVRADVTERVRMQAFRNQQTIAENGLAEVARAEQGRADIEPRMFQTFAQTMNMGLSPAQRGDARLVDAMNRAAADAAQAQLGRGPDALKPEEVLQDGAMARALLASLRRQGVAVTPDVERMVQDNARLAVGNWQERAAQDPGVRGYGGNNPAGAGINAIMMNRVDIMRERRLFQQENEQEGRFQSTMAQLGRSGPAQRLADALMNAGPATNFQDLVAQTLGLQDVNEVSRVFGTQMADLQREATQFRNADGGKIRDEFRRAAAMGGPAGGAEIARLERQYGITAAQAESQGDRSVAAAAREAAISRARPYVALLARQLEQAGYVQTRVTTEDVNRSARALRMGDASALSDATGLAERMLMDDRSMAVLGQGGLDRVMALRDRAQVLQDLAHRYTGGDTRALLSGNFAVREVDLSAAGVQRIREERQADIARLRTDLGTPGAVAAQREQIAQLRREAAPDTLAAEEQRAGQLEARGQVAEAQAVRAAVADRRSKLARADQIESELQMTPARRAEAAAKMEAALTRLPGDAAEVGTLRDRLRAVGARGAAGDREFTSIADAAGMAGAGPSQLLAQLDATDDERRQAGALNADVAARRAAADAARTAWERAVNDPASTDADRAALRRTYDERQAAFADSRGQLQGLSERTGVSVERLTGDRDKLERSRLTGAQQARVRELYAGARRDAAESGAVMGRFREIADDRYGGNLFGLIGSPDLARSAVEGERRALEVMETDLGMSFARGVDRTGTMSPEYTRRLQDVRRQLSLTDGQAIDEMLRLTGTTGDLGNYEGGRTGRQLLGEAAQGDRVQAALPALSRLREMGLERAGLAGKDATPAQVQAALRGLLGAKDEDLTPAQREERTRLMGRLSGGREGRGGMADVLRRLTSGDPVDARQLGESVSGLPAMSRTPPQVGTAARPGVVTLAPNSAFRGSLDITTGQFELRPIGQPGT